MDQLQQQPSMTTSGYLIVTAAIILAIWDGIAASRLGLPSTESFWFASTARKYPSFVLCIGILIGHFFARMKD